MVCKIIDGSANESVFVRHAHKMPQNSHMKLRTEYDLHVPLMRTMSGKRKGPSLIVEQDSGSSEALILKWFPLLVL